jgi:hypothetical protein
MSPQANPMQLFPLTSMIFSALPGRACSQVESRAILRMLAACDEAGVAAAPMLTAWAASQRGHQSRRVVELADELAAGTPMDEAVNGRLTTMLDEHIVAARYGGRMGLLPAVVQSTVSRGPGLSWRYRVAIGYLAVVLVMFLGVAGFLSLSIVLIYARIIDDFGMQRPASLELALGLSGYVVMASAMVPLVFLLTAAMILSRRLRRRCLWPWQGGERRAAAVELLGVAVAAGRPLGEAAGVLAACQSDRRLERKLKRVAEAEEPTASLAGLVRRVEAEQFGRLSKPSDQGWLLTTSAARRRERRRRRWTLTAELLVPIGVALMGLLVLVESLAVLGPLRDLVGGLS